jgi:1-acyl-sn-glycerol-3-phosphate acyltransferase
MHTCTHHASALAHAAPRSAPVPAWERAYPVERGPLSRALHAGTTLAIATLFRTYNRFEVVDPQLLPSAGPFVLIANHSSHIDALVLASALPWSVRRTTRIVAAGDVFFESAPLAMAMQTLLNAVPLWRKKSTCHALRGLRGDLETTNSGLILFPEGARARDERALPFKAGVGRLVAGTKVPIVPCFVEGARDALAPGRALLRPAPLRVRVGPSRAFPEIENTRAGWDQVTAWAMRAVADLGPRSWSGSCG